ncbi:hypothetical protein [Scytonema sp. PCC 10023]|uniref:hypothetical protein n=1 Tax=Scytonema sp. PCC 10023 TaxID=1680591 RepID=UPI0039C6A62A
MTDTSFLGVLGKGTDNCTPVARHLRDSGRTVSPGGKPSKRTVLGNPNASRLGRETPTGEPVAVRAGNPPAALVSPPAWLALRNAVVPPFGKSLRVYNWWEPEYGTVVHFAFVGTQASSSCRSHNKTFRAYVQSSHNNRASVDSTQIDAHA